MRRLVLLRHGQSTWNRDNLFTGWVDVPLSERGVEEASAAGRALVEHGHLPDIAYTSVLKRAIKTLWIVLEETDRMWIPVKRSWRLNERHYGALQGLNKAETAARHGEEQVRIWRRSYETRPPLLDRAEVDARYAGLASGEIPLGESLQDTEQRVLPCWEREIVPDLATHPCVLIAAHGNSLRALIKYLDGLSEEEVLNLEVPTGVPLIYELGDDLAPVRSHYLPAS